MNAALVVSVVLSALSIEHVRVELGDGRVLEDATVVIDGERIVSVGTGAGPAGATRIDGTGKTLTPGFIDVASPLGIKEVDQEPSTVDESLGGVAMVPGFRAADGFNPLSMRIPVAREEGVTSAVLAPGSGVLAGLGHWVPLTGAMNSMPDLKKPVAMFGDVGSGGASLSGGARGGLWLKLREVVADARWYSKNKAAVEQNRSRVLSLSALHLEALLPVLEGKVPLVLAANRASDILEAVRFGQAEKIRVVIAGGSEAWLVAAELKKAQVPVVLVPSNQVPGSFEQLRARDDLATKLGEAGVSVVIACNDFSRRRLRQEAGIAVSYGFARGKALSAITLEPARALGLEKELGSIEVGKRADLVLWKGDPLELSSVAEKVFIGGVEQVLATRQTRLVERYLERVKAVRP
ncbi:MAG: amidohydrolase family protein [Archangium sp.]|nr:amidohydrolase family protein [Archangium sp.]MDP3572221.1 amidohydrolase family protein [Archangium sp.]